MLPLFALLPWLGLAAFVAFALRIPRPLPPAAAPPGEPHPPPGADGRTDPPSVTVVVPARNEARSIEACVRSLTASTYPAFEVVVVDDRSEDDTGDRARSVPPGNARSLRVLDGEPVPAGWLGKQWACRQGAEAARGDLLLFIDADTVHEPDLLERAVAELLRTDGDLLTVAGRQIYGSFWERLVQPQVFFTMLLRYWNVERWVEQGRWRDAIASGAFLLFPRRAYDELGGHAAVKGAVAEDLALAQRTVRSGGTLVIRTGEDALSLRMYASLGELVRGWGKNIHVGGLQTMPPWIRPFIPGMSLVTGVGLWLAPPSVLLAGMAGGLSRGWTAWAAGAVLVSVGLWAPIYRRGGAPAAYALLYPLGAAVGVWIYLRSWTRGRSIEWKGRSYTVPDDSTG